MKKFVCFCLSLILLIILLPGSQPAQAATHSIVRTGQVTYDRLTGAISAELHIDSIGSQVIETGFVYSAVSSSPILDGTGSFNMVFSSGNVLANEFSHARSIFPYVSQTSAPTTLFLRAYARTHNSTFYGETVQLTGVVPVSINLFAFIAESASSISFSYNVNGIAAGMITEWGIAYSTSPHVGGISTHVNTHTSTNLNMLENPVTTVRLQNLVPGTTYYARAYILPVGANARNIYSDWTQSFVTSPAVKPTVRTLNVEFISGERNQWLNAFIRAFGRVTDIGSDALTEYGFMMSRDPNSYPEFGQRFAAGFSNMGSGNFNLSLAPFVNEVNPSFLNYVWAYATNSAGTSYGELVEVRGISPANLTIAINPVNLVPGFMHDSARFSATLNFGAVNVLDKGFVYSGDFSAPTLENGTVLRHPPSTASDFIMVAEGLGPERSYFVRAFARTGLGPQDVVYSDSLHFRTEPLPAPRPEVTGIGDVIGNIYSTDILATVNGVPIPSYSLNGKTAIVVEDLATYGLNVWFDNHIRTLRVRTPQTGVTATTTGLPAERGRVGNIVGNIYRTDIVVDFDNILVPAFAIDGRMCVAIEDLGDLLPNVSYHWNANTRTIALTIR